MSSSEDKWDCPVCFLCPEKVYQCTNGHLICQSCITQVATCPQCRVPFGENKIRNLAVEELLDDKTFHCKFKDAGCSETPKRKDAGQHIKCCTYRYRLRSLCNYIGFDCDYTINLLKPQEFIHHFQQEHGIHVQEIQNEAILNLQNVSEAILHSESFWTPIILKLGNDIQSPKFLIVVRFNKTDNSIWMGCNFLEDPLKQDETSFSLTFSILGNSPKVKNINWIINPSQFDLDARIGTLLIFPIFRISMSTLRSLYMLDNKINMVVNVTASGMIQEVKKGLRVFSPTILDFLPVKALKSGSFSFSFPWICSGCKVNKSGTEKGYKCLQCSNALCGECINQKKHSHHVFALLISPHQRYYFGMVMLAVKDQQLSWKFPFRNADIPESQNTAEKSFLFECQNCGSYPIMNVMYTCLLCPTRVDYCQSCVDKDIHRRHILGVILSQEQEEFINSHRKPGSALIPLIADKVNLE